MKIAVLTDSSSDLVNQQINDIFVLPLPIIFPDQIVVEDIKENKNFQEKILKNLDTGVLKTSALNPGILELKMKQILENYDHIIYFPIAYNLSNQYQNSLVLLNNPELKNKVTIIKHYFTGIQLSQFIHFLLPSLQNTVSIESLNLDKLVKQWEKNSLLSIVPGNINLLSQGGRVNKIITNYLSKRDLKIIILWRNKPKKMISKNYQDLVSKYCLNLKKHFNDNEIIIYLAHTKYCDKEILKMYANEFAKYNVVINFTNLPSVFAVHSGNNTVGFVAFQNIK